MLAGVRQGPASLERILVDGISHFGTAELARRLDAWATREGRKDLGSISGVKSTPS